MPVSFGRTGSQPGPGMRGGRTSLSASAPAPGRPARVATYLAMLGVYVSACTGLDRGPFRAPGLDRPAAAPGLP